MHRVSSVGRVCQPNCTAGSLFGITADVGDAILNASYMPDVISGTASVTRGTGFCLASDRGDTFKEVKCGFYPRRDLQKSEKSFVLARQTKGGSVRRRGGAVVASPAISDGFWFRMDCAVWEPREDDARSVGVPLARRLWGVLWRLLPVLVCIAMVLP
ncbi:hypothetical protein Taro_044148 [Colocasia esculenta]|uniref:Uncharacterized protein n=1 Tax=Colocasia esculenta TaxID=4460 RepID=A0A843WIC8_COLES|nr:hypothetical protein [Colocasia esculenta]